MHLSEYNRRGIRQMDIYVYRAFRTTYMQQMDGYVYPAFRTALPQRSRHTRARTHSRARALSPSLSLSAATNDTLAHAPRLADIDEDED